jgi:AraC-like DNA-binding protein
VRYWTTTDHPVGEQFSYWREVICQAFTPLAADRTPAHRMTGPQERDFVSWVRSSPLTSTNCAEISSRSQLITHGKAEVRRTDSDQIFINLQVRGHSVVTQGGRTTIVPAGGFSFVDTTSEYRQDYIEDPVTREWRVVSFRVPRANLVPLLADPCSFTAVAHDAKAGGIACIVASTMLSTWNSIAQLDRSAADAAETAINAVLAAAAGGRDASRDASRETLDAALRASINRFLAANLRGADLSATRVARRFGVSVRKLHKLYEGADRSFAQTIMTLRVEGCARELSNRPDHHSLTELATRWGFCDLSHLNRVFRAYYGALPSEFRETAARRDTDLGQHRGPVHVPGFDGVAGLNQ